LLLPLAHVFTQQYFKLPSDCYYKHAIIMMHLKPLHSLKQNYRAGGCCRGHQTTRATPLYPDLNLKTVLDRVT